MKTIEQHIFELLFQHDCVVLPEFGGFVANYVSAKVENETNRAYPPSKRVIFNKHLLNNDGLLAHKLIASENLTYETALSNISDYVNSIKLSLSSSKRFEIDKVGVLYLDASSNICFKPSSTNFLINSFGLPIVKAIPIIAAEEIIEEPIKKQVKIKPLSIIHEEDKLQPEELKEKVISINTPLNASKRNNYWWVAAAVIPIAFYSAWIPLKTDLLKGGENFQYSDLNPFSYSKAKISVYKKHHLADLTTIKYENISEDAFLQSLGDNVYTKFSIDDSEAFVTVKIKEVEIETTHIEKTHIENVASSSNEKGFFVIGGCFSKKSYAKNFVKELQEKGYEAMIVDQKEGLHRVAFGKYPTRKEAKKFQKEITKSENISVWVLKK